MVVGADGVDEVLARDATTVPGPDDAPLDRALDDGAGADTDSPPDHAGWRRDTHAGVPQSAHGDVVVEPDRLDPALLGRAQPDRREARGSAGMSDDVAPRQQRARDRHAGARRCPFPTTRTRIRSPSHPSSNASTGRRAPGVAVHDQHRPAGDPVPQVAERAGGPERLVVLERQVDPPREVRLEQVPTGVDVDRDRVGRRPRTGRWRGRPADGRRAGT